MKADDYTVDERLAVYGSLAPGKSNAHMLSAISGLWLEGVVRGTLHDGGWAASDGYPGLTLSASAGTVPVSIFCSRQLPLLWKRLDAFEGADYRRRTARIELRDGESIFANIYELA